MVGLRRGRKLGYFKQTFEESTESAMAVTKIDPQGAVRFPHFSQGVLVHAPGVTLYVAGQGGDLAGGFEAQARGAWSCIDTLLAEAGMVRADIVKVTGYVVSRDHVPAYRA